jgi:methionine synthase II (cobalamin-independent)
MLFYVENCVKFTDTYGDINETFYNSAADAYGQVIKEINTADIEIYSIFEKRLKLAAENACKGWGFYDEMIDLYHEIIWLKDDTVDR